MKLKCIIQRKESPISKLVFPRDLSVNELNRIARECMNVIMSLPPNVNVQQKTVTHWPLTFHMPIWEFVWGVNIVPRNPGQVIHGGTILKPIIQKLPEIIVMDCP